MYVSGLSRFHDIWNPMQLLYANRFHIIDGSSCMSCLLVLRAILCMALVFWAVYVNGFAPAWCPIVELFLFIKQKSSIGLAMTVIKIILGLKETEKKLTSNFCMLLCFLESSI